MISSSEKTYNIVFVGAGRLATNYAQALCAKGHNVCAVYSRTLTSAARLADKVGGQPTDALSSLPTAADAFILAVKDDVLPTLIPQLEEGREGIPFFHTAGSVAMSVFGSHPSHGVIYPLQTFSIERSTDFTRVHFFVEGNTPQAQQLALGLASAVSPLVHTMTSEQRRHLHLAAVFGSNFANHCYALAAHLLEQQGLPFDVLLPLIEETTAKVATLHPRLAQTGPAVRYDEGVIQAQEQLLEGEPMLQQIYSLMSKSIHQYAL